MNRSKKIEVQPVFFDGSIRIVQKAKSNRAVLKLHKGDYSFLSFVVGDEDFVGEFQLLGTLECISASDNDEEGISKAKEFSLAKLAGTLVTIRLQFSRFYDERTFSETRVPSNQEAVVR